MPRKRSETPTIKPHDNGNYYIHWYDAEKRRTKHISCHTKDPLVAQEKLVVFMRDGLDRGNLHPDADKPVKLYDCFDRYVKHHVWKKCADPVRQQGAIENLKRHIPDMPVRDFTLPAQEDFFARRIKSVCALTIKRELATLSAALRFCVKHEWLPKGDLKHIEMPTITKPVDRKRPYLTKLEVARLIHTAETEGLCDGYLARFIRLAYYTASRRQAIEMLEIDQIELNPEDPTIRLLKHTDKQTKKRKPTVHIFPEIYIDCVELIAMAKQAGRTRLFTCGEKSGYYAAYTRLAKRLGFDGRSHPHVLRHSRATHLVHDGYPLFFVAELLGDTMRTVEDNYLHSTADDVAKAFQGFTLPTIAEAAE